MANSSTCLLRRQLRKLCNLGFLVLLVFCLFDQRNLARRPKFWPSASQKLTFHADFGSGRSSMSVPDRNRYSGNFIFETLSAGTLAVRKDARILAEGKSSEDSSESSMCGGLRQHAGFANECEYLRANPQCTSGGIVEYISFFYCSCGKLPLLGYAILAAWLLALFYMLGNTAADYFCCSLEKLSKLLRLPPTVAGVTLLPLGNGAPDVFASIAAFVGADAGDVGLNSVLGGAVFVTSVVAGSVALFVAGKGVQIDKRSFVRDVGFFVISLVCLTVILVVGRVDVMGALAFLSIYVAYAVAVAAGEILRKQGVKLNMTPMHALSQNIFRLDAEDEDPYMYSPLLDVIESGRTNHGRLDTPLPQWMWASNVAVYSNRGLKMGEEDGPLWGLMDGNGNFDWSKCSARKLLQCFVEWPLALPRQFTIPIVEEDRWSKPVAVVSVVLAPILLALLWNSQEDQPTGFGTFVYVVAVILGFIFGYLAHKTTDAEHPPRNFLFPWVLAGFVMSIVWFYIIANELVALLVAFGVMFNINPSILGLTVLAWGNSMGDLMSNVALALNGGDGVQIAMSGCYAGPMFNTLIGLGVSLLLGSWTKQPSSYIIPKDTSLFYTLSFLVTSLLWALVVLPMNEMRPGKLLGIGLLILYSLFISFRLGNAFGLFSISGMH